MALIDIIINGKNVKAEAGSTILEAAKKVGIEISYIVLFEFTRLGYQK